jgi:hypothetical protein
MILLSFIYRLHAAHSTVNMDRLQPPRLAQRKRCPQGLKPVLVWVVNVRAEARTLQKVRFSCSLLKNLRRLAGAERLQQ